MKLLKVNNIKVVPIHRDPDDITKRAGYQMFEKLCCNTAIIGNTNSGKTTTLLNILKKCVGKKTNCIFFASAIHCDDTYDEILDMLEKKKCTTTCYDSLYDEAEDEDGQAVGKPFNVLNQLRRELQKGTEKAEDKIEVPHRTASVASAQLFFGEPTRADIVREEKALAKEAVKEYKEKQKEKKKKQYPELCLVFDDLGSENRDKSINKMMIKSRHFKSKCFLLLHAPVNLEPSSVLQMSYILIFGGFSEPEIERLYEKIGFKLPFHKFFKAYEDATKEPFNFFYIDRIKTQLRKNFNKLYDFSGDPDTEDETDGGASESDT